MTYGIKISKPGFDVKTTGIENLSMTSEKNSLKISLEGEWTQSVSANNTYTVTIAHNLGYKPRFRVYGPNDPSQSTRYQYPSAIGIAYITSICRCDNTNLYIDLWTGASTPTTTARGYYYIFLDES